MLQVYNSSVHSTFSVSVLNPYRRVRRRGGGGSARAPPHLEKKFRSEMSKEERKFRPDMSSEKNVHVPLRYNKIKTKKVGKKEDISKSRKRAKTKEIKKDDSRLSEIEIMK